MKKNLLSIILCCALFVACSNDDDGGNEGVVDGYKYLSTLNVTDAKSIFKQASSSINSSTTRVNEIVTGNTYWKIDANGESSQLLFTGEDGTVANIAIESILKLGSYFLLVTPNSEDLYELSVSVTGDCIVDTRTGTIYKCPFSLSSLGETSIWEDSNGDVYIFWGMGISSKMYKLDISDISVTTLLDYSVNTYLHEDGWVPCSVIQDGYIQFTNNEVRTPNNASIVGPNISGSFIYDHKRYLYNEFDYTHSNQYLYRVNFTETGYAKEVIFNQSQGIGAGIGYQYSGKLNIAKNCVIFYDDNNNYYEFNGTDFNLVNGYTDNNIPSNSTSNSWWENNNGVIEKLSMLDYSKSYITIDTNNKYLILDVISNTESPNIVFTAVRRSDSAYIIGTINEQNEVLITATSQQQKISDLIPIN